MSKTRFFVFSFFSKWKDLKIGNSQNSFFRFSRNEIIWKLKMEHGEWRNENEEWGLETGEWGLESEAGRMKNGVWRKENGMKKGEWRMISDKPKIKSLINKITNR